MRVLMSYAYLNFIDYAFVVPLALVTTTGSCAILKQISVLETCAIRLRYCFPTKLLMLSAYLILLNFANLVKMLNED